tara:strand:+ start:6328 stop:7200 length:873 start_codon:yes stop_codon:yes gene_type:complete
MKSLLKEMESKFKELEEQDQDKDGDKDFADIMIARMVASGMSKEDAIKKVKEKQYNEQSGEGSISVTDADKAKELADKGMDVKLVDEGLRGTLDEPYYIEVSIRDARKALNLFADKSNGYPEVTIYGSNVYASFVESEIHDLMEDFGAYDIEILESSTDEDIDEASTSSGAGAYNTPKAFSTPEQARKKKKMKYAGVAESMDNKYEQLIESYKNFALGDSKSTPDKKVKETIKEVSKKLQEIEQLVRYSSRLKTESGLSREGYGPSVDKALTKISERLVKISERVRALGE